MVHKNSLFPQKKTVLLLGSESWLLLQQQPYVSKPHSWHNFENNDALEGNTCGSTFPKLGFWNTLLFRASYWGPQLPALEFSRGENKDYSIFGQFWNYDEHHASCTSSKYMQLFRFLEAKFCGEPKSSTKVNQTDENACICTNRVINILMWQCSQAPASWINPRIFA